MSKNEKSWFDRLTEDITDSYFEARNSEYTTPRAVLGIVHFDDGSFLEVELNKNNGVKVMPYHADEKCDRALPNITKFIEDNLISWDELCEQWEDVLPEDEWQAHGFRNEADYWHYILG